MSHTLPGTGRPIIGEWVARFTEAGDSVTATAHLVESTREHHDVPGVVTKCGREMPIKSDAGWLSEADSTVRRCLVCQGIHRGTASSLPLGEGNP